MQSTLSRSLSVARVFAFILIFIMLFQIDRAFAQTNSGPEIFDVRRSLPMEPDEPVTKDFYINAGPESGMKKGVYISVVRSVPIHDPIKNVQQATLNIPVGKLQVIDVQRGITVARLQSELGDDERPTLEFEGVMIGDHIDLGSITTDAPKKQKKEKRHVASNDDDSAASTKQVSAEKPAGSPSVAVPTVDGLSAIGTPAAAAAAAAAASTATATQSTAPAAAAPSAAAPAKTDQPSAENAPKAAQPRSADASGTATTSTSDPNLDT